VITEEMSAVRPRVVDAGDARYLAPGLVAIAVVYRLQGERADLHGFS